ncbi:viral A-type inclusion protein [Oceanivirga miroungae]|uniref:Uncharacterized protein n=1 Tax=Oceanivirga miroungae TaxID=1130046 RepID=A0A6I8MEN2_9FUSO|nr:viral A-type inclusion protein [Oceanivirga miroungae]VWL85554.1 hypothetical protein OMES3154_00840 [Oceanivirga miroungae]
MKSKMVNPNSVTDMEIMNIKNQAKMTQVLQKVGRGRRKVEVYLSKTSQKFIEQLATELKKQMAIYDKKMPNIFDFFDYIIKCVHVEKRQKREKYKKIMLSYDEKDFLDMQIKGTLEELERQKKALKWYNIIKKIAFSSVKKQNEFLLNEIRGNIKK